MQTSALPNSSYWQLIKCLTRVFLCTLAESDQLWKTGKMSFWSPQCDATRWQILFGLWQFNEIQWANALTTWPSQFLHSIRYQDRPKGLSALTKLQESHLCGGSPIAARAVFRATLGVPRAQATKWVVSPRLCDGEALITSTGNNTGSSKENFWFMKL